MFKQLGRPKGTRNVYSEEDIQRRIFLGKKLKRRRRQIKLTQTDIAKEMKVTFQQVQKYEKGQNRIPIVNLVRISKFLNKPLDYFLDINKETMIQSIMSKMNNEMRK